MQFSPEGSRLLVAAFGGVVTEWSVDADELVDEIEDRGWPREFTDAERAALDEPSRR